MTNSISSSVIWSFCLYYLLFTYWPTLQTPASRFPIPASLLLFHLKNQFPEVRIKQHSIFTKYLLYICISFYYLVHNLNAQNQINMNARFLPLISFALFIFLSCSQAQSTEFEKLDVAQFEKEIQKDSVLLIDVRTPQEYEAGHIENARNWNFYDEDFFSHFEEFEKDRPIYLYCKSGGRSSNAANKLTEMGYKNIHELKGGMQAWKAKQ